ncbi:MAG: MEKHLA domain-containing protein [Gallionellaceae bacterium]
MTQSDRHDFLLQHVALLRASYLHWTGLHLIDKNLDASAAVEALDSAPFALVSHGTGDDPIFNYGNHRALELFEMDSDSFTRLPSRLSAATANQGKRGKALDEVSRCGFIEGYSGIRIAKSGRHFRIRDTTIWNLVSPDGRFHGQAALIAETAEL